jgi:hypothetical protein
LPEAKTVLQITRPNPEIVMSFIRQHEAEQQVYYGGFFDAHTLPNLAKEPGCTLSQSNGNMEPCRNLPKTNGFLTDIQAL